MSTEGELLIIEKYGTFKEREYCKPPDQNCVVTINDRAGNLSSWFSQIFLPQGYPNSVSRDYIAYQIWDTAQAFCSTITGTLATKEVLKGVGVGNTTATPLAATITWVLKEGCGHLGKILFASSHGIYLDAYSKKWRLYADLLNDAAMCIEIALPLFRNYVTFTLCITSIMKSIVGVAGGASRVAMTQHHALRGNMADVAAKDSAQETAVNFIASFSALFIISLLGESFCLFLVMVVLHMMFNYLAVRSVCLKTLNEPRFLELINIYFKKETVATPCTINALEPILLDKIGKHTLDKEMCGFKIITGCSLKVIMNNKTTASHIAKIKEIYQSKNYVIVPDVRKRSMFIFIKDVASSQDVLCAYFHAVILSCIVCVLNHDFTFSLSDSEGLTPFGQICNTLESAPWASDKTYLSGSVNEFLYEPTYECFRYINTIASKEWEKVQIALIKTGWDLSKHLIIADEWRISTRKDLQTQSSLAENFIIEPKDSDISF